MKTLRSRVTSTVLIGTLTMFGLAACGSDDEGDDSGTNDSSSDTQETTEPDEDSGDEGNGDKPSKEEVVAGYSGYISESAGGQLPEGLVDQLTSCIFDDVYDDLSAESAQALADGGVIGVTPEDAQKLATSTGTCTQELVPQQ
ncbi:MAG: hypothetical protein P1U38_16255 [Aeromicrobium sp.]|uniref:hypothetical protein n=1 Tax=Aeromicrobium sp. TaxID=1871063 RepID=UPI00260782C7|nr:hypothetical protein [Aeromicrobium sp.]MDF1706321.1 hypothetical protein [Aeromicrobium sp.]